MIKSKDNFLVLLMCYFFVLYTHMVLILSTGIYFSGMMVIGQFYRNLNSRMRKLKTKFSLSNRNIKRVHSMQEFCDFSDELDELTGLYEDITNHAINFSKYQRCFTSFSLTQYFVILLAEVCISFFQYGSKNIPSADTLYTFLCCSDVRYIHTNYTASEPKR